MKFRLLSAVFLSLAFLATNSFGFKDPLGEVANYKIDKDPKRTTNMIKSGTVVASVPSFNESSPAGPSYEVHLDYHFQIALMGSQDGTEKVMVEKEFFTDEFMDKLRKEKHYEGPYFKADHQGYADAKNLDGKFYPHCDVVLLYDLKQPPGLFLDLLAASIDVPRADIENLKALVHVFKGIPVLGGAKIDVSGVYSGMNVKAGGDYIQK